MFGCEHFGRNFGCRNFSFGSAGSSALLSDVFCGLVRILGSLSRQPCHQRQLLLLSDHELLLGNFDIV